jgi:hypothetical protein
MEGKHGMGTYIWPVKLCIPLSALLILLHEYKTSSDLYYSNWRDPVSDIDK